MTQSTEQFFGTVNIRTLHELDWPIFRLLARSYVERLELRRYKRQLLTSRRWDRIRAVPHKDRPHLFDLYGVPTPVDTGRPAEARVSFPRF